MPIAVTCPTCHARTKAPDAAAGRKARCPKCGSSVPVPPPEDLPDANRRRSPTADPAPRGGRRKLLLITSVITLALAAVCVGSLLAWNTISESGKKARAEQAIHTALTHWCSPASLDDSGDLPSGDYFSELKARLSRDPRPTDYQITGIHRAGKDSYEVAVTLTFPGGPETRVYGVTAEGKTGKHLIMKHSADDISGTEAHARSILRAWLDGWVAGEDMATFKRTHPEAAAKMTTDVTRAAFTAEGKRLVRYDITSTGPAPGPSGGFRFTVTAVFEERGISETKMLRYEVFKDRALRACYALNGCGGRSLAG